MFNISAVSSVFGVKKAPKLTFQLWGSKITPTAEILAFLAKHEKCARNCRNVKHVKDIQLSGNFQGFSFGPLKILHV